jgi:hypothetical protein
LEEKICGDCALSFDAAALRAVAKTVKERNLPEILAFFDRCPFFRLKH